MQQSTDKTATTTDSATDSVIPTDSQHFFEDMEVTLLDCMGNDLTVVNAARVSFNKRHKVFTEGDADLIEYLARNGHWSPFAHPQLSFRIKAPIFVERQLFKHQVGLAANSISRRYVDTPPTYYLPDARQRDRDVKQGSKATVVKEARNHMAKAISLAHMAYMSLLDMDVAPEIARAVLPLSMMTEWVWTGSLYAFARVCNQRLDRHAQRETTAIAERIYHHIKHLFPISTTYLVQYPDNTDTLDTLTAAVRAARMTA